MLTLDYLKRRGRVLANRCFLCEEEEESIDHLLVHCSKAKVSWDIFLGLVGVSWVFPKSVKGDPSLLAHDFCWEEMQESLDDSPSMHFLDIDSCLLI